MDIDRRVFLASVGGLAVVEAMDDEAKAEALEHYMMDVLDGGHGHEAEGLIIGGEAQVVAAPRRRHDPAWRGQPVRSAGPGREPEDGAAGPDVGQADAARVLREAIRPGQPRAAERHPRHEDRHERGIILACLLHDVVLNLVKVDHGWWGAQMLEPYVPERTSWAIRYHQALRFYPDPANGDEYPELYTRIFGKDYVPQPHIKAAYDYARNHKWYLDARMVTVNDLYAFDPNAKVSIEPFQDIIGRHFKQPKEGLGNDNSPTAHMWRTMMFPDNPL